MSLPLLEQGAKFGTELTVRPQQCSALNFMKFFVERCLMEGLVSSKTPGKSFIEGKLPPEPFYFTQPIQLFSNLTWILLCPCKVKKLPR